MFYITLENCAFIHLVNVFFCTASCSSVEQKEEGLLQRQAGQIIIKTLDIGSGYGQFV